MVRPAPPRPGLDRLRILQIIPALAFGGLERVATTLSVGLAPRVARVVVCSSGTRGYMGGAQLEDELRSAGLEILPIPRPSPQRPRAYASSVIAMARILRRERPDVVHAHNPAAAVGAAAARLLAGTRGTAIVATHHGVTRDQTRRAAQALSASSDIVVGIGPTVTNDLRAAGVPEDRSATVFNAVEVTAARPRDEVRRELGAEGAELVVTVGRYIAQKNQRLLLRAVAALRESRPRLRAAVVGYGELEDDLKAEAEKLQIADRVAITGARADAVSIVAAADAFALTSTEEGLGLVVLEAMAVGCPVVATAAGGIVDSVSDGETGLLVRDGDATALADALGKVLDDKKLRDHLVAGARDLVEREFSVETMIERYGDVYERAVALRRR